MAGFLINIRWSTQVQYHYCIDFIFMCHCTTRTLHLDCKLKLVASLFPVPGFFVDGVCSVFLLVLGVFPSPWIRPRFLIVKLQV